jgi:hypothetical protein
LNRKKLKDMAWQGRMGKTGASPSYVSEKETTPSLLASKNAACFCSSVMPPAPVASPYADTWPTAFRPETEENGHE